MLESMCTRAWPRVNGEVECKYQPDCGGQLDRQSRSERKPNVQHGRLPWSRRRSRDIASYCSIEIGKKSHSRFALPLEHRGPKARDARTQARPSRDLTPAPTLTHTRGKHPNVSVLRKEEAKSKVPWKRGHRKRLLPAYFVSVEPRGKDPTF